MDIQPVLLETNALPDPLWCAWFSGFLDGEATFNIIHRSQSFLCDLRVKLRADDATVLREVHATLKCGGLYERLPCYSSRMRNYHRGDNHQALWTVQNRAENRHVIIPLLDRYPLHSKKARDYSFWREAVLLLDARRGNVEALHQIAPRIMELKAAMQMQRAYTSDALQS